MSFNFGQTSQPPSFGNVANKPANAFNFPAGNTASSTFGGNTFGTTNTAAPAFGNTNTAAPAFGSNTFGNTSTAPPAFGNTSTAAPAFGSNTFGNTSTAPPAFGSNTFGNTNTAAPAFGSNTFGNTNTAAPAFGSNTFGSASNAAPAFGNTSTAAPAFGGNTFGNASNTAPVFGGNTFGAPATSTAAPAFGAPNTLGNPGSTFGNTGSAFGNSGSTFGNSGSTFGNTGSTFGNTGSTFGNTGNTFGNPSSGTFGSPFGAPKPGGLFGTTNTTNTTFTNFGQPTPGPLNNQAAPFGAPPMFNAPSQNQQTLDPSEALYKAVLQCCVFGDERDALMARLNMLQASWGVESKAFFSSTHPPVQLGPDNPLCRFKTIGYSAMPSGTNEDGLVSCVVRNKKASELKTQKTNVANALLSTVFNNKPNLNVVIESLKPTPDSNDHSFMQFKVQETAMVNNNVTNATNAVRTVPTDELLTYLNTQTMNLQQKFGIDSLSGVVAFSNGQIQNYLENTPANLDPRLWRQAQLDNPDPRKLLPIPLVGFKALQQRLKAQGEEANTQQMRLDVMVDETQALKKKLGQLTSVLQEARRKQLALAHRVLHIMVKLEEHRKSGYAIQPEDEHLRTQLETLLTAFSAPMQFKGRLKELLPQIRLMKESMTINQAPSSESVDTVVVQEARQFLKHQHEGIQALVSLLKDDLQTLDKIKAKRANNP